MRPYPESVEGWGKYKRVNKGGTAIKKGKLIGKISGIALIFAKAGLMLGKAANRVGKAANPTSVVSLFLTVALALSVLLPMILPGQANLVSAYNQIELITNGGFESGSTGWSIYGDFYADSRFSYPHSGTGYAYLSNSDGTYGNNLAGSLEQTVTIPSSATSAMFTFWYSITTNEPGSTPYDLCDVIIFDSNYNWLATAAMLDNTDSQWPISYTKVSLDLTDYIGQTIKIVVEAITDASYSTVFRLDDFSILAILNQSPTAYIDSITPNPATQGTHTVSFTGHGSDSDGSVVGYNWRSSRDGQLSTSSSFSKAASALSAGTHTIYFKVRDDDGVWSPEVLRTLTINSAPTPGPVSVATYSATNIGQTQATLRGAITSFNNNPSGEIRFWYRPSGGSWSSTTWAYVTSTTTYSKAVDDLNPDTDYEFYAEGHGNVDTTISSGNILSFETEQSPQERPLPPTNPRPGSTTSPGPVLGSNTVTLQWDASSGATRYGLGVVNCNTLTFEVDTWVYDTSYPVTLQPDTPYQWNVAAWNDAGYSDYTALLYFQTPPAGQPDLRIVEPLEFPRDIPDPFEPNVIKIRVQVENVGSVVAENVEVSFKIDGVPIEGSPKNIGSVEPGGNPKPAEILWRAASNIETATLEVEAQSVGQGELKPSDNVVTQPFSFYFVPFRHDRDAFSFENWYYNNFDEFNQEYVAFLEAALGEEPSFGGMARFLVGITVGHFLEYFKGVDGHCYGMALSSALWKIDPSKKPVQKQTFDMSFDEAKAEIIWNHWGQSIYIISEGLWEPAQFNAQEEYNEILTSVQNSRPCLLDMVISITNRHSVTAYKILDIGTEKRVYVYDNNFPLSSKQDDYYITFEPELGITSYVDPDGTTYRMIFAIPMFGVSKETLTIVKDALKLFLEEIISELQDAGSMLLRMRSPVSALLTDQHGRRIGYVGSTFINEIPGAEMQEQLGSCFFYLPKNLIYSVEMTGTGIGTLGLDVVVPLSNSEARVAFWEDIPVASGSEMTMSLNAADTNYEVIIDTGEVVEPETVGEINIRDIFEPPSPGWCFIATAAYGTPMAEEIEILREFRDEYLLTSPLGQALVGLYYKVSPPIAEFITEHPILKQIVRTALVPAVSMSTVVISTTPVEKIAIVGLLVLVSVGVAICVTRRRGRGPEYA